MRSPVLQSSASARAPCARRGAVVSTTSSSGRSAALRCRRRGFDPRRLPRHDLTQATWSSPFPALSCRSLAVVKTTVTSLLTRRSRVRNPAGCRTLVAQPEELQPDRRKPARRGGVTRSRQNHTSSAAAGPRRARGNFHARNNPKEVSHGHDQQALARLHP